MTKLTRGIVAACAALLLSLATVTAAAQQPAPGAVPLRAARAADATVGSPQEAMRALLALLGDSTADSARAPAAFGFTTTRASAWINSTRPVEENDGAVWQGRGLTVSLTGGFAGRAGFLSYSLRPLAFATQNATYDPARPAGTSATLYRDPWRPGIDHPYRFGAGSYARLEPGETWVRAGTDAFGAGVSTASQRWGPARVYPLVLGTEAAGVPRAFVEADAVPIGIGTVSAAWIVGRLEASRVTLEPAGARSRMITAVNATYSPSFFRGLTVGGSRFFHVRWTADNATWNTAALPFKSLLKRTNALHEAGQGPLDYNQLASVFARVAPPGAGVEVYGEFYREDHNINERDLAAEPDHQSAYTIGLRRAWRGRHGVSPLTLESLNARYSHIMRLRSQGPMYVHGQVSEGHTYLGQTLGSSAALGGGGATVRYERIGDLRSVTYELFVRRTAQNVEGGTWEGRNAARVGGRVIMFRGARSLRSWSVGVDHGIGLERGTNVSLSFSSALGG